jgi:DNA-directed RNA polymerase subunit RPC12/RpoP
MNNENYCCEEGYLWPQNTEKFDNLYMCKKCIYAHVMHSISIEKSHRCKRCDGKFFIKKEPQPDDFLTYILCNECDGNGISRDFIKYYK